MKEIFIRNTIWMSDWRKNEIRNQQIWGLERKKIKQRWMDEELLRTENYQETEEHNQQLEQREQGGWNNRWNTGGLEGHERWDLEGLRGSRGLRGLRGLKTGGLRVLRSYKPGA